MRMLWLPVLFIAAQQVVSAAQAPAAPPSAADQTAADPAVPPVLLPADSYTYQPDERRDPFLNLLGTGNDPGAAGVRAEGAAGLAVAEITVSGVLESRGTLIAMVKGPDNKSYVVHQGDRFVDGTIRSITPQGLTIVQEVNDPLSLVKQREIRKLLRSLESAKE